MAQAPAGSDAAVSRTGAGAAASRAATLAEDLARFDRRGPRYTSYPTAVEFDGGLDATDYERLLASADAAPD
ncbi:MAG: hypothetical protein R3190_15830, partial [Thermoanaerobaculia bacterium]|nr:hypothetical protein [Thermoanaerobaculia bacterium]